MPDQPPVRKKAIRGYLVVLATEQTHKSRNQRYRGIDRMPPFDQDLWNRGIEWPTLSSQLVNEHLLATNRPDADRLLEQFSAIFPRNDLELLLVTTPPDAAQPNWEPSLHLGYDLAGTAPYYSVVGDPPLGEEVDVFLTRLNEHGLFCKRHLMPRLCRGTSPHKQRGA